MSTEFEFEKDIRQQDVEKSQRERLESQSKKLAFDFKEVLKTESGRRVLKAIFELCPVDFNCYSGNTNTMAYNCGRQSIGLELRQYIKSEFGNDLIQRIEQQQL